jgi:hypothetical protein
LLQVGRDGVSHVRKRDLRVLRIAGRVLRGQTEPSGQTTWSTKAIVTPVWMSPR